MIFKKVVIVGPGLIGGSVGMGLKRLGLAEEVIGVGHRQQSLDKAVALGAIDRGTLRLEAAAPLGDLVLICTGVESIPQLAARALPAMKPGSVLSDVGSTKEEVTRKVEAAMPGRHVAYLGTHPLAGLERRGIEAARDDLFRGSLCIFTPTEHTTADARELLAQMWQALGARVRQMAPATHDRLVGDVSHLAHLAAAALVNAVSDEALELAAAGFRDTTRIASGDPELWAEIFLSNKDSVAKGLLSLLEQIGEFAAAFDRHDKEALLRVLRKAKERRDNLAR